MSQLLEDRAAALATAHEVLGAAKTSARPLTKEESDQVEGLFGKIESIDDLLRLEKKAAKAAAKLDELGAAPTVGGDETPARAKSLGEHFVKELGTDGAHRLAASQNAAFAASEFKAATDPQVTAGFDALLTDVDTNVVRDYVEEPVVADLLGTGKIGGSILKYFREGPIEGAFTTVAEAGQKPQLHVGGYTEVTTSLAKIAGWFDISDEMVSDLPYVASEINQRGVEELARTEEAQILNGTGAGSDLTGILATSGIQAETSPNTLLGHTDSIFKAITKCKIGSGLQADGLLINPVDYERIRLSRDANGQLYGGGPFFGPNGGSPAAQPALWGLRTIPTTAVAAGTALVGNFRRAATLYRKGGVTVEATNSDGTKFTKNLRTIRIEERLALAVRRPAGFVKVTLTALA